VAKDILRGRRNERCRPDGTPSKANGALLVAVSIVAAIRLRGDEIKPSPKLNAVVHDSLLLARTILARMERG
jgi:hypothetical protein